MLHAERKSPREIAEAIGCHKSTISRELNCGTTRQMKSDHNFFETYFPETGQIRYEENRKACGAKLKLDSAFDYIQFAEKKILEDDWSPDAVWGHAKRTNKFDQIVCTKPLYNYIDKGLIKVKIMDLPMKMRFNTKTKRIRKNKRILGQSIDERPEEIKQRQEFGHWEIDTVSGKKSNDQVLMTLTERKIRNEIIFKVNAKNSVSINKMIAG